MPRGSWLSGLLSPTSHFSAAEPRRDCSLPSMMTTMSPLQTPSAGTGAPAASRDSASGGLLARAPLAAAAGARVGTAAGGLAAARGDLRRGYLQVEKLSTSALLIAPKTRIPGAGLELGDYVLSQSMARRTQGVDYGAGSIGRLPLTQGYRRNPFTQPCTMLP